MRAQSGEYGVGNVADTDLQGQELPRNPTHGQLAEQEPHDMAGDSLTDRVGRREITQLVREYGLDHPHDFLRIDAGIRLADPLQWMLEVDRVGMRRRLGNHDVRHLAGLAIMKAVDLDNDPLGGLQERRRSADRIGQEHPAVGRHLGRFDDREIDTAEDAVQNGPRHMRQMHVHKRNPPVVDALAKGDRCLVRGAPADRVGRGQCVVDARPRRRAGQHTDRERLPGVMKPPGPRGQARDTAFADPAAVKPLNATMAPSGISSAASSAVTFANGVLPIIHSPSR